MVIQSFTSPDVSYHTTGDTCTCKAKKFNPSTPCKHMRKAARLEAGLPTTVNAARAARIERNRQTSNAYYRMAFMQYGEF